MPVMVPALMLERMESQSVTDPRLAGLLALAPEKFEETGNEKIHVLSWSSNVIKRVCRSTLQAEAMSLQLGSEDAEQHQAGSLCHQEFGDRDEPVQELHPSDGSCQSDVADGLQVFE